MGRNAHGRLDKPRSHRSRQRENDRDRKSNTKKEKEREREREREREGWERWERRKSQKTLRLAEKQMISHLTVH